MNPDFLDVTNPPTDAQLLRRSITMLNQIRDQDARARQVPAIAHCFDLEPVEVEFFSDLLIASGKPFYQRFAAYQQMARRYNLQPSQIRALEAGWLGMEGYKCGSL